MLSVFPVYQFTDEDDVCTSMFVCVQAFVLLVTVSQFGQFSDKDPGTGTSF